MILATALACLGLVAVIVVIHREQRRDARAGAGSTVTPDWSAAVRRADTVEDLATASLPRARMGYSPLAVRAVLAQMASAYTELAAVSDPDVVARAWDRARSRWREDIQQGFGDASPAASRPHADATEPDGPAVDGTALGPPLKQPGAAGPLTRRGAAGSEPASAGGDEDVRDGT